MTAFDKAWSVLKYRRNPYGRKRNNPVQNTPDENTPDENTPDESRYFRSPSTKSALADVHGVWNGVNREEKTLSPTGSWLLPGGYPNAGPAPEFNPFHPTYQFNPLRFQHRGFDQSGSGRPSDYKNYRAGSRVDQSIGEVDPRIAQYATIDPKPGHLRAGISPSSLDIAAIAAKNPNPYPKITMPNLRRVQGEDERIRVHDLEEGQ